VLKTVEEYIEQKLVHSIHTTERRSFRGCRRRHKFIFIDGYYPKVTARPLEFGVAFHAAMETYYGFYLGLFVNPDPDTALQLAIAKFKEVCNQQYRKFVLNNPIKEGDPEVKEEYDDRVRLGVGMLRYYFLHEAPKYDQGLKPVKVEQSFEVPIYGPNKEIIWCKCDRCKRRWRNSEIGARDHDQYSAQVYELTGEILTAEAYWEQWEGLPVTYGGRIDIIFEDAQGRYWIGDWKTAMRISGVEPGTLDDYMYNDDQITSYCWALWLIGIPVAGFIYAEIKKAVPEEPEPLKAQRLGRMYSTNKQQATTYDLYLSTIQENDTAAYEEGLYDEFLNYLKYNAPVFHHRHDIPRNDEELRNCGLYIYQEAKEIIDPNIARYPNPGRFHCKGFTDASGCAFWEPCLGMNRGEDWHYTLDTMFEKRTKHYYEEAPPTTDKRMEPA